MLTAREFAWLAASVSDVGARTYDVTQIGPRCANLAATSDIKFDRQASRTFIRVWFFFYGSGALFD